MAAGPGRRAPVAGRLGGPAEPARQRLGRGAVRRPQLVGCGLGVPVPVPVREGGDRRPGPGRAA